MKDEEGNGDAGFGWVVNRTSNIGGMREMKRSRVRRIKQSRVEFYVVKKKKNSAYLGNLRRVNKKVALRKIYKLCKSVAFKVAPR